MRRTIALFLAAIALAAPAMAEDAPQGGKPGTNVPMEYVMAPLTGANGKLLGYAYILPRITATSEAIALTVRDKVPFIQDAFIRDVNGKSVAPGADPEHVDIAALESRLLGDAARVMGAGKVKMVTVCTVQIAELLPAKGQAATPPDIAKPMDAHDNPVKSRCEVEKPA